MTMAEVAGRLEAVRRVVVPPEAVVTPAVRDELLRREHRPGLRRSGQATAPAARAAGADRRRGPTSIRRRWLAGAGAARACRSSRGTSDCLIAATDQLAAEVAKPDTLGVLLTRHAAAGLVPGEPACAGVRAVAGSDAAGGGRRGRRRRREPAGGRSAAGTASSS